jgi:CheY-like chemotaxis protein
MHESSLFPLRCALPDGAIFDVLAGDINQQGLDFYMIDSPALPIVGDSLKLTFDIPELKEVAATATIENVSKILDMARFGIRFTEVSEGGQPKLMECQRAREPRTAHGKEEGAVTEKPFVFVIDEPQTIDSYSFLDQNLNLIHSNSFDVIGRLLAASPDAILFNSSLPDSDMVLQILTNHPVLKGTPVIELQKTKRKNTGNFFSSLVSPMGETLVLDTLYQAISARRISRMLHEGEFSGPFKTGISILLVDDSSASETHDVEILRGLDCNVKLIEDLKLLYDSFVWSTPDVIAIDENTKEIDALTVCRLLNMNRELKDVPKVLLSEKKGHADPTRSNLFSSVLTKPFTARQLLSEVHYLLAQTSR